MTKAREALLRSLAYIPEQDRGVIERAIARAEEWHDGQFRGSGEPYVTHPIAVAQYLATLEAGTPTIVAALLHDVVEDDKATMKQVTDEFGEEVARLVEGVTKLSKMEYQGRRTERQLGSLRKMLLTASSDLRVIFIKLADRWHNIETIAGLRPDKQVRVAHETLDIYVPFARLVGLWELKTRFENICFPIAEPEISAEWKKAIKAAMDPLEPERKAFVERVNKETTDDIEARLDEMTDYEIYTKLQGNLDRLREPSNIDSVLITLKGKEAQPLSCYRVLGEIHQRYPVRVATFRDFISSPQQTGYRALHTVIFLSRNHDVKLRIQTQEMYDYVAKRKLSSWMEHQQQDIYSVLNSLHAPGYDPQQYMSDLKGTVLGKRINVFTSSGAIMSLPQGATGIDFAFAMNPDHLSYLESIRVNGDIREATFKLRDGDIVDLVLLSSGNGARKTLWVDKAKSVEARESLKGSLKRGTKQRRRAAGRDLLEMELRKWRMPVWALFHWQKMQRQLAEQLQASSFDDVLLDVGSGERAVSDVIEAYRHLLLARPAFTQLILKMFGLLPRSRVLSKDASIIDIEVYALDRPGLIYEITRCFAERKINIAKFGVFALPPKDALYKIRLEVKDFNEFSDLYDAIMQVPSVRSVLRKR